MKYDDSPRKLKDFERTCFFEVSNCSNLLRIGSDAVLIHEESKKESLSFSEVALFRIQDQSSFVDAVEHDTEAFIVHLKCLVKDNYVIQIAYTNILFEPTEDSIHETPESGRRTAQAERHYIEFEEAVGGHEGGLLSVGWTHRYLPVSGAKINGREVGRRVQTVDGVISAW